MTRAAGAEPKKVTRGGPDVECGAGYRRTLAAAIRGEPVRAPAPADSGR